jgi:hypothetical protein
MTKRSWIWLAASAAVSVALLGVGCDDDDQLSEGDGTTVPPAVSVPATAVQAARLARAVGNWGEPAH